jgi:hypothetical protein
MTERLRLFRASAVQLPAGHSKNLAQRQAQEMLDQALIPPKNRRMGGRKQAESGANSL